MGAFNINITGVGGHGCDRRAVAGEKLHGRCGKWTCPDCLAYEFVQRLRQAGMVRPGDVAYTVEAQVGEPADFEQDGRFYRNATHQATFTHWPEQAAEVVDDMLTNSRKSGRF